ncbi:cannabinoid receptor 2 [Paramuricea clavata]|uniref:Cannabinoid receptor 2 n=1 Tax=Paramuricea clavata TaxID=317549 RepID=A0A6S7IQP9_PARCT|nr:cannabinoid receptor 2 [Paramuricea clavata]
MIIQSRGDCRFNTELKTTKIVFTVLAIFIVLWTPYTVVYVSSSNSDKMDTIPPSVFKFCGILTAMHSMSNSIIYLTMIKSFRKIAMKLLRKIFSCVLPANEESAGTTESLCCDKARCSAKITPLPDRKILRMPVQVLTSPAHGASKI